MSDKTVTESRRNRKKKSYAVQKKNLISVISLLSVLSIVLLLPVFSQSLLAYMKTLLSLCTLLLFGGMIVYLTIRLVIVISDWTASGKHGAKPIQPPGKEANQCTSGSGSRPVKNSLWWNLGGVASILMWAFILKLFQPFVTTLVCWQGYKLMGGKSFSLGTIEGTIRAIEGCTYFVMFILILLLSQFYWSRCGRRSRYKT